MTPVPFALRSFLVGLAITSAAGLAAAQEIALPVSFDSHLGPDGGAQTGSYLVSMPMIPADPDVASVNPATPSRCVGDSNGPSVPDGSLSADDLICAWWTSRPNPSAAGAFAVSFIDPASCSAINRVGTYGLGRIVWTGVSFPVDPHQAFLVQVASRTPASVTLNPTFLHGEPDPAWTGQDVEWSATCAATAPRRVLLNLPHDAEIHSAAEILCGKEGVDWFDADGNGRPDTCWNDLDGDARYDAGEPPTGIYDGEHAIAITRYDNSTGVTLARSLMARRGFGGRLIIAGTNFDLVDGEAYMASLSPGHRTTRWDPARP